MSRIAAVVVAYRDADALDRCLESLHPLDDVWVANVTADAAVSEVIGAQGRFELAIEENVGYAAAVNSCVEHLDPGVELVLVLNDDVELVDLVDQDPTADVCIPMVVGRGGPDLHRLPTPTGFLIGWVLGQEPQGPASGSDVPIGLAGNGAALLASREVLVSHPLPSEYFMYWEETAWFWRLQDVGRRTIVGGFTIRRPDGTDEISELKSRQMGFNLMRLADERGGRQGAVALGTVAVLWILRLLVTDLVRPSYLNRLQGRRWLAAGLVRGFARSMRGGFRGDH